MSLKKWDMIFRLGRLLPPKQGSLSKIFLSIFSVNYCWWQKSCTIWDVENRRTTNLSWLVGFFPSTVWLKISISKLIFLGKTSPDLASSADRWFVETWYVRCFYCLVEGTPTLGWDIWKKPIGKIIDELGLELLKHQQCPIVDICNTSPCLCNLFSNQCSYFFANLEVERLDLKTPCAAAFLVEDERHTHPSRCGEMKEHYNETGSRKLLKDKSWRKTLGTLRSEETLRFDLGTLRSDLGTLRSDLISGINCMRSMLQDPLL